MFRPRGCQSRQKIFLEGKLAFSLKSRYKRGKSVLLSILIDFSVKLYNTENLSHYLSIKKMKEKKSHLSEIADGFI